ncbi:MAG TPA: hypothetical protein VFQ68_11435 [Streptosporangiaceae bacterium]|nr:hypothetical protein [Streptosporangiaceae bacterium]
MICVPCRQRQHQECPGGSWCDCQHQPPAGPTQRPAQEPALSWLRQG